MDDRQFDDLVKRLVQLRLSRLEALRGIAASALAGLAGVTLAADESAAKRHHRKRKSNRQGKHHRDQAQGKTKHRGKEKGKGKQAHPQGKPTCGKADALCSTNQPCCNPLICPSGRCVKPPSSGGCGPNQIKCNGGCITMGDANCGACGVPCPSGQSCCITADGRSGVCCAAGLCVGGVCTTTTTTASPPCAGLNCPSCGCCGGVCCDCCFFCERDPGNPPGSSPCCQCCPTAPTTSTAAPTSTTTTTTTTTGAPTTCSSASECGANRICDEGSCRACTVCASGCDYSTVQAAIDGPHPAGPIVIAICPGTYVENITINQPLTLVGADPENTILNGGKVGPVLSIPPRDGFVFTTVWLRALTLRNGNSSGNGGGIYSQIGQLMLDRCRVTGNTATNGNGGGIYSGYQVILTNSHVTGNTVTGGHGGGIFGTGGLIRLTNSTVTSNSATDGGGIHGGDLELDASRVGGNTASGIGGGIHVPDIGGGQVTFSNSSSVDRNQAGQTAGGLYLGKSNLVVNENGGIITCNTPNNCVQFGGATTYCGQWANEPTSCPASTASFGPSAKAAAKKEQRRYKSHRDPKSHTRHHKRRAKHD